MIPIGEKIKKARKEKKITQEQLANDYMSRSMLSHIENGKSYPSMKTLEYIASKLDKPLSYFLADINEQEENITDIVQAFRVYLDEKRYEVITNKVLSLKDKLALYKKGDNEGDYINIIYSIAGIAYYHTGDYINSKYYIENSKDFLQPKNERRLTVTVYNILGLLNYREKNYRQMEDALLYAYQLLEDVSIDYIYDKLNVSYNLALAYYYQKKYFEVITLIEDTIELSIRNNFFYNFGELAMLIAVAYKNINKISEAIKYNKKAQNYYYLVEDKLMISRCHVNLSILYRITKDYQLSLDCIEQAINYFDVTNNFAKFINSKVEKIITLFFYQSDSNLLIDLINETINHYECSINARGELLTVLASIKLKENSLDEALVMFKEAENILHDAVNSEMYIFAVAGLCKVHELTGDSLTSAKYLKLTKELLMQKPYYMTFLSYYDINI